MRTIMITFVVFGLALSCASKPSKKARSVKYVKHKDPPADCKEVGTVALGKHYPIGQINRISRFREMAAELGGNYLRYDRTDEQVSGQMHGTVFKCPENILEGLE